MATRTEMVLGTALIVTIVIAVTVVPTMNRAVGNVGKIRAIGFDVFADRNCTSPLTQIDWGLLSPGEMALFTMYARNSGNVNITLPLQHYGLESGERFSVPAGGLELFWADD